MKLPPYVQKDKKRFAFLLGEDFAEKHNVAWRVEQAEEDANNPILTARYPWESAGVFSHGTVMHDPTDGLWKAWYIATQKTHKHASAERRLAYAESEDGVRWRRPELDLCPYPGHARTNILLDLESGGPVQHASVILHPDAPPEHRYEMFVLRLPGWECPYDIVKGFPVPEGKKSHKDALFSVGMFRYRSADGRRWEPWEQAKLDTADSAWVSQLEDGSYVLYSKIVIPALPGALFPYDIAAGVCRIMVRRTSSTGSDWGSPEITLTPDWLDPNDTQFMEITPLEERDGMVSLVTVYHTSNQTIDLQLAGSRDGKRWWRPDRRAALPLRPLGDLGGGMVWPMHPLIEHNGRIYLYYAGCEGLHNDYQSTEPTERMSQAKFPLWPHWYTPMHLGKDVFSPVPGVHSFHGALCRASWKAGRLWAAVTASGGDLTGTLMTRELRGGGSELRVNAVTVQDGTLEAELVVNGDPVSGFGRADCLAVRGDHSCAVVRWKGGTACPAENVQVRFYLQRARLYGFEFTAAK